MGFRRPSAQRLMSLRINGAGRNNLRKIALASAAIMIALSVQATQPQRNWRPLFTDVSGYQYYVDLNSLLRTSDTSLSVIALENSPHGGSMMNSYSIECTNGQITTWAAADFSGAFASGSVIWSNTNVSTFTPDADIAPGMVQLATELCKG
jgi:hypothetical protein